MKELRHDWTEKEIADIYEMPLLDLVYKSASMHRKFHDPSEVQVSSLLSIKTGACSEDCAYCPQSARYKTGLKTEPLIGINEVIDTARKAKEGGATRFCMGAAWREVKDDKNFEAVLDMVRAVNFMDMEVCCTLGMLTESQAKKLKEAGLYAYNHNIDSSKEFYKKIITTRTFQERLDTLQNVRNAGITVCCGGILGMGETQQDRINMLLTLSTLNPHPESVPINALVPIRGTPLANKSNVPIWDMIRMIATTRIILPQSVVRLSAGRLQMSKEGQALCFLAGANSIFAGDKLLTTPNPEFNEDMELFNILGLKSRKAFKELETNIEL